MGIQFNIMNWQRRASDKQTKINELPKEAGNKWKSFIWSLNK